MAAPTRVIHAHEKYGLPLGFAADSESFVTGGFDGSLARWDLQEGSELAASDGHDQSVNCGALVSDGTLVTGSTDTTVRRWTLADLDEVSRFTGHGKTVAGIAAHAERPIVGSVSYDTTVRLWDVETETAAGVFEEHRNNVTSVSFIGDHDYFASGGIGDSAIVWELDEPTPITRLTGHGTAVVGIDSQSDDRLWTCAYDGTIRVWATDAWQEVASFMLPSGDPPSGIAVHPHEDRLGVTKDHGVIVLDDTGSVLDAHELDIKGVYRPRWSPDGRWLAVGGADGRVRLYDSR